MQKFARMRRATRREQICRALEPNPIGPPKAPHKCPTATSAALRGPAAFVGTRATAALASSRSERPTSSDGRAAAADDAVGEVIPMETGPTVTEQRQRDVISTGARKYPGVSIWHKSGCEDRLFRYLRSDFSELYDMDDAVGRCLGTTNANHLNKK